MRNLTLGMRTLTFGVRNRIRKLRNSIVRMLTRILRVRNLISRMRGSCGGVRSFLVQRRGYPPFGGVLVLCNRHSFTTNSASDDTPHPALSPEGEVKTLGRCYDFLSPRRGED